jgi:4-alpha-glucanotransferase
MMPVMDLHRSSGVLLHPTSLPGPFGIGDLGPEAYRFVDFLADTGQTLWQILPLGPTGYGNSPYMCFSAFAGNPLLVSLEKLVEDGLLDSADIQNPPPFPENRVDYGFALAYKMPLLAKSFIRLNKKSLPNIMEDFSAFSQQNASWLNDYSMFMALKEEHGNHTWTSWENDLAGRNHSTLMEWSDKLRDRVQFHRYIQYLFFRQWQSLKNYCHTRGVRIIGDMPIYVAHDSAEVWVNPGLFHLDEHGNPLLIAGVPPDYFSATGQRWGNPIYRWDIMAETGYQWWIERFRLNFTLFDILRIDHFRGFEAYWEVPASEPTAMNGRWVKGPGASLFQAVQSALGDIQLIAEDLGVITVEVDALRDRFNFPGMRVLQMAFGNDPKAAEYRPHNHTRNSVVYTATHDHNTTNGWFTAEPGTCTTQTCEEVEKERKHVLQYINTDGNEINWDFIRLAAGSVARMAIFPLQDILGLGTEARMNLPGTTAGNWEWRFEAGALTPAIKKRLREMITVYERNP